MRDPNQLPIHFTSSPEYQPVRRHHSTRYYVHRVQESLATRLSKMICSVFLTLLLVLGIITFVLWLSLRPHRPRFHVQQFLIPSLSQASGFENAEIEFNVTVRNANQHIGVYFDTMEATVYYRDQKVGSKTLLFPFYQPPKNTTVIADVLSGATISVDNQRWTEFMNDRQLGTVPFRLDVTSMIRFKVSTWLSKHHRMHATCDVSVGSDGLILASYKDKRCPVYFT
ncbi:hypothetical protein MLD38_012120 [Melastoma candidum]|uniref:Uncharacterized protein n=1 Tax=Melastoma candidum TaxID=119954 RepID=A0ACB9R727_9MYRT|nr:hypothetical protein MLD38_012120 [Melastoma candidum]